MRLFSNRPLPPPPPPLPLAWELSQINAIAHGNSWVANFYTDVPSQGFVQVAAAALGISILNKGVGSMQIEGATGNSMTATGAASVDANLSTTLHNVLFGLEGINQCVGVGDGDRAYNALAVYSAARRAYAASIGATLHICILLAAPANIGVGPDYYGQASINAMNAAMIVYNARIRANPQLVCDSYIDLTTIPGFDLTTFDAASFTATGVYSGIDRVHPNIEGHRRIGVKLAAEQAKWLRRAA